MSGCGRSGGNQRSGERALKHRRSKLEVYLDVLWTIKKGTRKPTRIMYESNLSWKPLQRTLNSLISQELIVKYEPDDLKDRRTNTCYELTQKGENVIKYFKRAEDLIQLETSPRARL